MNASHQHIFPEQYSRLGPCTVCGLTPADALEQLDGDQLRAIVSVFISETTRYSNVKMGAKSAEEFDRWTGMEEARVQLAERIADAGVSLDGFRIQALLPSERDRRNAAAVRALHVLVDAFPDVPGMEPYSFCKACGYESDDLDVKPCPTLAALNQTDPPPAPPKPVLDTDTLIAAIYRALNAALCNEGTPGWKLLDEAKKAASAVLEDALSLDLTSPELRRKIAIAIASPARREGSVPDRAAESVIQVLTREAG